MFRRLVSRGEKEKSPRKVPKAEKKGRKEKKGDEKGHDLWKRENALGPIESKRPYSRLFLFSR